MSMIYEPARFVKPFDGFEAKYQGNPSNFCPIAIPGTFDPQAGKPGYSPQLIAGIPMSLGNPAILWLPRFVGDYGAPVPDYFYTLTFRLRNIQDKNADVNASLSYHLDQRLPGVPNDPAHPEQTARFVLPVCSFSISAQSLSTESNGVVKVQGANLTMPSTASGNAYWSAPFTPSYPGGPISPGAKKVGYAGVFSQGQFSGEQGLTNETAGYESGPSYAPFKMDWVPGDEMLITVSKSNGSVWDFQGEDLPFSNIFGTANGTRSALPNTGIGVMCGDSSR